MENHENEWLEECGTKTEAEDTEELSVFRRQWQEELRRDTQSQHSQHKQKETEAANLYWMGVAAERSGDTHSALVYYRHAVQLIPDIEYRVHSKDRPQHMREEGVDSSGDSEEEEETEEREDAVQPNQRCVDSLTDTLHSMTLQSTVCHPERPSKTTHISVLPYEVMRMILYWVVSVHLDMRSLEQCSMVCRGFYCLVRQPGIWRTACRKLWPNCNLTSSYGNSWRQMYIHRPHLCFHGVYISKISYVRRGERSLDGYYKPYHTVVYYRYLRFFPDGQ
jgi:F-box protein 9